MPGEFTASSFVASVTGVDNVCERAAMVGAEQLLVSKTAMDGVTVAVALMHWEVHLSLIHIYALSTMTIQMESFYASAVDADIMIYNSTIDGEIRTIDELLTKSPLLADCKAVQEGLSLIHIYVRPDSGSAYGKFCPRTPRGEVHKIRSSSGRWAGKEGLRSRVSRPGARLRWPPRPRAADRTHRARHLALPRGR